MTLFTDYVRYEPLDHVNLEFTNPDDPDPVNILQAVLNVLRPGLEPRRSGPSIPGGTH